MKSSVLISVLLFCIHSVKLEAKSKLLKVSYFKNIYGHIHQNASKYSTSLTTITCGHPVKILKESEIGSSWYKVKVGPYTGFIHKSSVSEKREQCFQEKYPRFFDGLNLEIADMFYWGRLYDHYVEGRSKAQ